jgi:hypothetical protein
MPSPNPSLAALQTHSSEATLSPYAAAISLLQSYHEDAESRFNTAADAVAYCPRTEFRAMRAAITELSHAKSQVEHLKAALFKLREAEVYCD